VVDNSKNTARQPFYNTLFLGVKNYFVGVLLAYRNTFDHNYFIKINLKDFVALSSFYQQTIFTKK